MSKRKEDLIDYTRFLRQHGYLNSSPPQGLVNLYLKSINSEATIETPSVNDNEAQEKYCTDCMYHTMFGVEDVCASCNNFDNWKQY